MTSKEGSAWAKLLPLLSKCSYWPAKAQFERYYELLVEWNQKSTWLQLLKRKKFYLKLIFMIDFPILQGLIENQEVDY